MEQLLEMLTYKRPNRSQSEEAYIRKFIAPHAEPDAFGNYIRVIGNPRVMFSSHTDTVHKKAGMQKVYLDTHNNHAFVDADCLGADDGTGNWLMLEMIRAGKEGLYVFHRGEECGGLGSTYISKHETGVLANIDHAIAFDRAYHSDIITSQSSGKCCSDKFADSLGGMLGAGWAGTWGTFTDTANYNHLIPECTNISVGYLSQHTKAETQDIDFARWLRDVVLDLKWQNLPVERDVTDFDDGYTYPSLASYSGSASYYGGRSHGGGTQSNPALARWDAVMSFVEDNPDIIADFLIDTGIRLSDLRNYNWNIKPATYDDEPLLPESLDGYGDCPDDDMTIKEWYDFNGYGDR